jgi:hypothetical protein
MFKKLLATLVLVSSTNAFAADIYGKWAMQQEVNGFKFTLVLAIEQNVTHVSNTCEYQGKTATASVDVPSKVEGNTYSILAEAKNQTSDGGFNCDVSAQPMSVTYSATDTQLTMSANGQQMVWNRVQ